MGETHQQQKRVFMVFVYIIFNKNRMEFLFIDFAEIGGGDGGGAEGTEAGELEKQTAMARR